MKNTLIIGATSEARTQKLKEMVMNIPDDILVAVCERATELPQPQRADTRCSLHTIQSNSDTRVPSRAKPALMVINGLETFDTLAIPSPVYASMNAATKEEALTILKTKQIHIEFEDVIELPF